MRGENRMKLRRKRLLFAIEVQWRFITYYREIMYHSINGGAALSKPKLLRLSIKLDKHIIRVIDLKEQFEKMTGEPSKVYNKNKCNTIDIS